MNVDDLKVSVKKAGLTLGKFPGSDVVPMGCWFICSSSCFKCSDSCASSCPSGCSQKGAN